MIRGIWQWIKDDLPEGEEPSWLTAWIEWDLAHWWSCWS